MGDPLADAVGVAELDAVEEALDELVAVDVAVGVDVGLGLGMFGFLA